MEIARLVKASGNLQFLLPGAETVADISYDLLVALEHAFRILSWQESLGGKEMPPQWMWAHASELNIWFDEVDTYRRQKYGIEDDDGWGEEPQQMTTNELSSRFRD